MADQQILREYLVALGFKVDNRAVNRFDDNLKRLDIRAAALGKGLAAVATTAVAMVQVFARNMEKLYYTSRYVESTASNIQALEFGARNIGLEGGRATAALKAMSSAIRSNPGLIGLLNSLGVEVKGRDKADVLTDLVAKLKTMPFYIAERYANMFGIDQETLFYLTEGLDKMKAAQEQRKKMAQEMGLEVEKSAEVAVEYMNMWREIGERASIFTQVLAGAALPFVRDLVKESTDLLTKWSQIVTNMQKAGGKEDFWRKMREGITGAAEGERVTLSAEAKARLGAPEQDLPDISRAKGAGIAKAWQEYQRWRDRKTNRFGRRVATDPAAVDAVQDLSDFQGRSSSTAAADDNEITDDDRARANGETPAQLFARLEKKYGLPPGLLDRVWKKESGRGKYMLSPAGAKGHFGFMDATADEYGLTDPNDLTESADAASRKFRDLLKRYGGDQRKAAAAYNWGDGNLARYGLARAPRETRDYMDAVAGPGGVTVNQETNINIAGVRDAAEAGRAVAGEQRTVNADIARNFAPKVR